MLAVLYDFPHPDAMDFHRIRDIPDSDACDTNVTEQRVPVYTSYLPPHPLALLTLSCIFSSKLQRLSET